jgi:multiple antibiotic resistance protein
MVHSLAALANFWFVSLTSIFFLVDPFAAIPAFLIMTSGSAPARRRHMALRATVTCFVVLTAFAFGGSLIFRLFGITLPAFKIAGGLILILIGLDMLQARRSATHETPGDTAEGAVKEDVGIIPLGIPMLAGPGSISTIMVLTTDAKSWIQVALVIFAVATTAFVAYWILSAADRVRHFLGETGIRILTRMFGLILTAIAVQFVLSGLADAGFTHT